MEDLALHNGVEHNASLAHGDANPNFSPSYAPTAVDVALLDELMNDSEDGEVLTALDVARARVRRETSYKQPGAIDSMHQEIARGEMSLVLELFGAGKGIPLQDLRVWFEKERFPDGWRRNENRLGILKTIKRLLEIKGYMNDLRVHKIA